jgi:hypothetical protein
MVAIGLPLLLLARNKSPAINLEKLVAIYQFCIQSIVVGQLPLYIAEPVSSREFWENASSQSGWEKGFRFY